MEFRTFGKTNLKTSLLGMGCASLSGEGGGYGFGKMSEKDAQALVLQAVELGINIFDTAPIYGFGLSEERLGKYLPKDQFIVSKGGVDWHSNKRVNMSNDPQIISRMLHESLTRLKRETIDLYMIHWPDPRVDIRLPLEVLIKAKEEGKIRFIGLCNTNQEDLTKAQSITRIDVIQSQFNYLESSSFHSLKDLIQNQELGFMSWGTFDKGILTGRVSKGRVYDSSDARSWAPWWKGQNLSEKLAKVAELKNFADSQNLTLEDLAIAWQMITSEVSTTLIGWKNSQDLHSSVNSLKKLLGINLSEIKNFFKYQP
jgi:myo-inositol catabolism protein IolS